MKFAIATASAVFLIFAATAPQRVVELKSGSIPAAKPQRLPGAPASLTAVERLQLLKGLGQQQTLPAGTMYLKVSSSEMEVNNRGSLQFSNADWVDGGDGISRFLPNVDEKYQFVQLTLKSEAAGRRYVVDCAVRPFDNQNVPFKIRNYEGELLQTIESSGDKGQHLVFAFEGPDSNWHSVRISRPGGWYFYSCEVTTL